jgi:spiro-SPASM protein
MKVFLVLNWPASSYPWWMEASSKSLLDHCLQAYLKSQLIQGIWSYGAAPPKLLEEYGIESLGEGQGGLEAVFTLLSQKLDPQDRLIFSWWDYPLVTESRIQEILDLHDSMRVEYTNSDGYPLGLFPEIIQGSILANLAQLAASHPMPLCKKALFDTIATNINAFDIETLVSPTDQRSLRVEFSLAQPSTVTLIQRLGKNPSDQEAQNFVSKGTGLRTLPRHFTFQLIDNSRFLDAYRYHPKLDGSSQWELGELKATLQAIKEFAGEGVISFALCEASEYPEILSAIRAVQELKTFDLVIETSARGWTPQQIQSISALAYSGLIWIVEMDSQEPTIYQQLRGPGFEEAQENAQTLLAAFPGQVYPQAVRTTVTDPGLETFYNYWKEKAGQVIVQKHNDYSGRRKAEKILDLAPINRQPCWHIKRDLVFWADGMVSPCRDDWDKELVLGNCLEQPLPEIWENGDTLYKEQLNSSYKGICEACDEYYIYHF